MSRGRLSAALAAVLIVVLIAGAFLVVRDAFFAPKTITAYFPTATAIYPGDDVRVAGVKVGTIEAVEPAGTQTKIVMNVGRDVPVPADASAVIVAQNLIAARYIQLAPAYLSSGPKMSDGAVIPLMRTGVPVEWDEVKEQLARLATELGPASEVSGTSAGRFIDSAASALDGNGDKLRTTLAELSGVTRILADGSGDLVDVVKNLQVFVTALRNSNTQLVTFNDRLATLSSVVDGSRSNLDAALTDLSVAVGEVQRFVAGSRTQTAEQIQRLSNVTQNLVDNQLAVENLLHVAPNGFANAYNSFDPNVGAIRGTFTVNNFNNPIQFICGSIGALENVTATESAKLCAEYLGPAARLLTLNYLPIPINPFLAKSASPDNLVYAESRLAPGGEGGKPAPPETPPVISAYTGLEGDVPPPAGYGPPPYSPPPNQLPAFPSPALYPGAPVPTSPGLVPPPTTVPAPPAEASPPGPPTVEGMLLPAERPAP